MTSLVSASIDPSLVEVSVNPVRAIASSTPTELSAEMRPTELSAEIRPTITDVEICPLMPTLFFEASSGTRYELELNNLTVEEKNEIRDILRRTSNLEINISDAMDSPDGCKDSDIQRLVQLVTKAIGHPISWKTPNQAFATSGLFLQRLNREDKDLEIKDLERALSQPNLSTNLPHTPKQRKSILKRANCAQQLLRDIPTYLKNKKRQINDELNQPDVPDPLKASLKKQLAEIEETLRTFTPNSYQDPKESHAHCVKRHAILMTALYPFELSGKTDDEIIAGLEKKEAEIRKSMDSHKASTVALPFIGSAETREYDPVHPFLPCLYTGVSSEHEDVTQKYVKSCAQADLNRNGKHSPYSLYGSKETIGPEHFIIHLMELAASDKDDTVVIPLIQAELHSVYFERAFRSLHPGDDIRDDFFQQIVLQRKTAQETAAQLPDDVDAAAFSAKFDEIYKAKHAP